MKDISQIKPRLGQGRVGLRHKNIKTPIPIVQATEKQSEVLAPKPPKIQDKSVPIPYYATAQMKHRGYTSSRKTIQHVSREIPIYPDPVY